MVKNTLRICREIFQIKGWSSRLKDIRTVNPSACLSSCCRKGLVFDFTKREIISWAQFSTPARFSFYSFCHISGIWDISWAQGWKGYHTSLHIWIRYVLEYYKHVSKHMESNKIIFLSFKILEYGFG